MNNNFVFPVLDDVGKFSDLPIAARLYFCRFSQDRSAESVSQCVDLLRLVGNNLESAFIFSFISIFFSFFSDGELFFIKKMRKIKVVQKKLQNQNLEEKKVYVIQ